jgi:hypothetical protein
LNLNNKLLLFVILIRENANVNEELMMTQAEIDHLKNR